MQNKKEYYEIDLLHLVKVLWERIWLIILATIIAGGVAFGYAFKVVEPKYQSSALFYVNNSSFSLGSTQFSISSAELSAAKTLVDTYIVILESRTTLEDVAEKAGLEYTYEKLNSMVDATAVNNTEIFRVTVTSTDPKEAETIANTICLVLPRTIANVVDGSDVRIVDYAVMPENRVSPSYTKYTAIGAVIGVVVSAAFIVLSDMFDDIIHDTTDMTDKYNIPILAVIPNLIEDGSGKYGEKYYNKGRYEYYYRGYKKAGTDNSNNSDLGNDENKEERE